MIVTANWTFQECLPYFIPSCIIAASAGEEAPTNAADSSIEHTMWKKKNQIKEKPGARERSQKQAIILTLSSSLAFSMLCIS